MAWNLSLSKQRLYCHLSDYPPFHRIISLYSHDLSNLYKIHLKGQQYPIQVKGGFGGTCMRENWLAIQTNRFHQISHYKFPWKKSTETTLNSRFISKNLSTLFTIMTQCIWNTEAYYAWIFCKSWCTTRCILKNMVYI